MKKEIIFTLILTFIGFACRADMKWTSELSIRNTSEATARNETVRVFHSGDAVRIENDDGVIIADFTQGKLYRLMPENELFQTIDPRNPIYQNETSKKLDELLEGVMKSATLEQTGEERKILDVPCELHILTVVGSRGEIWAAKEFEEFTRLRAKALEKVKAGQSGGHFLSLAETGGLMGKIDDFIMHSLFKTSMMEIENKVMEVEVVEKLDPSLFAVPDGFVEMKVN